MARRAARLTTVPALLLAATLAACGTGRTVGPGVTSRPTAPGSGAVPSLSAGSRSSSVTSSSATSPARTSAVPRGGLPDPRSVDGSRPDAVAVWVLTAWYGYDTLADTGPSDTARRALPWLSPTLAAVVRQAAPVAAPTATWTRWAQARAYATVHLAPSTDDHPPDTALDAYRGYRVDLTLHPAQPADTGDHLVAFVHLRRTDLHDPWRVEEVLTR